MDKNKLQLILAALFQVLIIVTLCTGLHTGVKVGLVSILAVASVIIVYLASSQIKRLQDNLQKQDVDNAKKQKLGERRLQMIMESSPMAMFLKDCDGKYQFINKSFEEMLGVNRDEIIGGTDEDYLPPELIRQERETDQRIISNGLPVKYELKVENPNGGLSSYSMTKHLISCEMGDKNGIVGFAWDVTHRKQTGQQLKKLFSAMEQSPVSVVITNKDGSIEYVNSNFTRVTGYTLEEAIGQNPRVLKSGHQPSSHYAGLWKTILSGKVWKGEFLNKRKNGEEFWEHAAIAPVVDELGEITNFVAVKEDISERKQTEKNLHRAKLNAEAANRAKNVFLTNMSQEIRTPLNTILGFSQLLGNDSSLGDEQKSILDTMRKSGKRLQQLINDVLEMSRIESGKMDLNKQEFNVHHMIHDVVQIFSSVAQNKGIKLIIDEVNSISPKYIQDESKVRLILINLLRNAVDYTRAGEVNIRLHTISRNEQKLTGIPFELDEQSVLLKFDVQDTGLGIHPDEQERIFESFEQGEAGKNLEGGSGLGLAISRQYARMMGGDVVLIHSEPDKGSLFRAVIKAKPSTDVEISDTIAPEIVEILKLGQQEYKVLYVDDKHQDLDTVMKPLVRAGFVVERTGDLNVAIDQLKENNYQCLIYNIETPQSSDWDFLEKLKALPQGETVVSIGLISKDLDVTTAGKLAEDFNGLIQLPLLYEELFAEIRKILGVQYTYSKDSNEKQSGNIVEQCKAEVAKIPLEVRKEIYRSVQIGDLGRLEKLITEIDPKYSSLKDELINRLRGLDLDSLSELFKHGASHYE